jgi:hypothetical protein
LSYGTGLPDWELIPGLLKKFRNTGSGLQPYRQLSREEETLVDVVIKRNSLTSMDILFKKLQKFLLLLPFSTKIVLKIFE